MYLNESVLFSLQVIETALQQRGVQLACCRPDECSSPLNPVTRQTEINSDSETYEKKDSIVIGFIVNERNHDSQSLRKRIQRRVVSWLGVGGRHWYAITAIRRISGEIKQQPMQEAVQWRVLNSESDQILDLTCESELMEYLRIVSQNGGSIFRAKLRGK